MIRVNTIPYLTSIVKESLYIYGSTELTFLFCFLFFLRIKSSIFFFGRMSIDLVVVLRRFRKIRRCFGFQEKKKSLAHTFLIWISFYFNKKLLYYTLIKLNAEIKTYYHLPLLFKTKGGVQLKKVLEVS